MSESKIALVTGAAKGIGLAIAGKLVVDGFFVILIDIDDENGKKSVTSLGDNHAQFIHCNIDDEQAVDALFEQLKSKYGKLDVLVNNAGILRDRMIHKMTFEDFKAVIDVNLGGTWLMCRAAACMMREQKSGRIINISSRAWLGNMGQSNYSASKAGIIGLTRVLALELGPHHVLVNAVAPGLIDTPLTQKLPEEVKEKLIKAQPTREMGRPEDVANAVAFLASDNTKFLTGQTIYVDGGKSIGAGL